MKIQVPSIVFTTMMLSASVTKAFGVCAHNARRSIGARCVRESVSFSNVLQSRGGALFSMATADETATAKLQDSSESYKKLLEHLERISYLEQASAVLHYDQMVSMPQSKETSASRGAQMAALAGVIHSHKTDPNVLPLIQKAQEDLVNSSEDSDAKRLLELEEKSIIQNQRVPAELASKAASLSASAYSAWNDARSANDFAAFAPVLKECFDTAKLAAQYKRGDMEEGAQVPDESIYTQMLDDFEVGMSKERIDQLFSFAQEKLIDLIGRVTESKTPPSTAPLHGTLNTEAQQAVCRRIVTDLGFDETHGRIDVSVHPFTTSFSPNDVRITSRFREDEWYQGLAATFHEGGHAMYEQNMPASPAVQLNNFLSMGTHESQSLFWERHIGLSRPFWEYAQPILKEHFGDEDFTASPEELYRAVNAVQPDNLIRVEADELTYPLHVILRYQIESEIVDEKLSIDDLPQRWNDDMNRLLHVTVPSDAKGCLQDVHWSGLAIGYFPTYLIGAMAAAQLAHKCREELGDLDGRIQRGEFQEIRQWLTDRVHRHGRRYASLDALFEDQLGEPLNVKYYIDYLTEKYEELYGLK